MVFTEFLKDFWLSNLLLSPKTASIYQSLPVSGQGKIKLKPKCPQDTELKPIFEIPDTKNWM